MRGTGGVAQVAWHRLDRCAERPTSGRGGIVEQRVCVVCKRGTFAALPVSVSGLAGVRSPICPSVVWGLRVGCGPVLCSVTNVLAWLRLCDGPCEVLTPRGSVVPSVSGRWVW